MYGIQTRNDDGEHEKGFENDVKMYGIQTGTAVWGGLTEFENDVKMYGIQTGNMLRVPEDGLRMM